MNKYDKYKDTNIEWIGEIPKNWGLIRTKYIFDISKERITEENPTILSLTQKGIKIRDVSNNEGQVSASYSNYAKVRIGDIVLNPMDLISGFVDSAKIEGIISPAYTILRPSILKKYSSHPEYHNYYFQKHYLEGILFHLAEGVSAEHRWTLKNYDLQQVKVLVPSLEEQTQISSYLDNKTSLIDKLINNNKKLIKLLEEKRTALINKVITKGLDPNVKMKDSGIEWIGEIPEHWEIKKLKYLASVNPSNVDKKSLPGEVNVKLCNYLDVYRNDFIRLDFDFMDATAKVSEVDKFPLCKGDILLTKDSETPDDIAIPALVDENMEGVLCGYHLTQIKPTRVVPGYLFWFIKSDFTRKYFETHAHGVTRYSISVSDTVSLNVLVPSKNEQAEISIYLNKKAVLIDKAIKGTNEENKILKEYRQSLISNVVTGKINVQDYRNN